MLITMTYKQAMQYLDDCEMLARMEQEDLPVPALLEATIVYNYNVLASKIYVEHEAEKAKLLEKYGTLGADGKFYIDTSSKETLKLYNSALQNLDNQKINLKIKTVKATILKDTPSLGIETMMRLNFMLR